MSGFTLRPTLNPRLNEPAGFAMCVLAVALILSLVSYYPLDPSANVAGAETMAHNLVGIPGAWFADIALQSLGMGAFLLPIFMIALGWFWLRSSAVHWPGVRATGAVLLLVTFCWALSLGGDWFVWSGVVRAGGVLGAVLADVSLRFLNRTGTALLLAVMAVTSLYLLTTFQLEKFAVRKSKKAVAKRPSLRKRFQAWRAARRQKAALAAGEEVVKEANTTFSRASVCCGSRTTLPWPRGTFRCAATSRPEAETTSKLGSPRRQRTVTWVPITEGGTE